MENPSESSMIFSSKHSYSQRFWHASHPGVSCRESGQLRVYTGLNLFIAFDHWNLAVQSQDLTTFQTPLGLLHLTSYGSYKLCADHSRGHILHHTKEMPDIAAAFMDDMN